MSKLQIRSIEPPLDDPETTDAAIDVLKSMEAMGLLPDDVDELTLEVIRAVATRAAEVGIGESAAASLRRSPKPPGHVAAALRELGLALEGSPMPAFEWPAMLELFGAERLAELLGVSVASLRRYAKDERPTPDVVAARLHLLARIVAELRGAYSEIGVRRWFERSRTALRGRAPGDLLTGGWIPTAPTPNASWRSHARSRPRPRRDRLPAHRPALPVPVGDLGPARGPLELGGRGSGAHVRRPPRGSVGPSSCVTRRSPTRATSPRSAARRGRSTSATSRPPNPSSRARR